MPLRLLILENKRLRSTLEPSDKVISIGSDQSAKIHLPDPRIAAQQAVITEDPEGYQLEVLNTDYPTLVNRSLIRSKTRLHHADEIDTGPFSIRVFVTGDKPREQVQRERNVSLAKAYDGTLPLSTIIRDSAGDLQLPKADLEQMTILALRLGQLESVTDFLQPTLRALLRTFAAKRAWMGVRRQGHGEFEWTLALDAHGQPCERPAYSQVMQQRCVNSTQSLCVADVPTPNAQSAMGCPLSCQPGTLGMLYLENDTGDAPYTEAALHGLAAMACCVAAPLETVLRKSSAKRQAIASTEHLIARATQDALTIRALPRWDELQVAAYRRMGSDHCCDFYDIVQFRDHTASILVAKICARPMMIPMYLAQLRSAFRNASLYAEAPHLFARSLNWLLFDEAPDHGIDLATAWIAPATGKVQCCLAGQGVTVGMIQPDGSCSTLAPSPLLAVGKTRGPAYEVSCAELPPGSSLFFVTQGATTAVSGEGKSFGIEGVSECLADSAGNSPGQILSEFAEDLTDHVKEGRCPDDVSVVLLRRN